jgi:hypothetical protein
LSFVRTNKGGSIKVVQYRFEIIIIIHISSLVSLHFIHSFRLYWLPWIHVDCRQFPHGPMLNLPATFSKSGIIPPLLP